MINTILITIFLTEFLVQVQKRKGFGVLFDDLKF